MKKILGLLAGLSLSLSAWAQVPTDGFQQFGWTSITNGASSSTNLNTVIDVGHQASVGVQLTVGFNALGSTNSAFFLFTRSADGVTYDTVGQQVSFAPLSTTATATIITNLPSYGARFIKINAVSNNVAAAIGMTNVAGGYAIKLSSP